MTPLYGFLEGDTIGLLVLAGDGDTVAHIAEKLQAAAAVRVAPRPRARVLHEGRVLDPRLTVADAGLQPLDRFDVTFEEEVR